MGGAGADLHSMWRAATWGQFGAAIDTLNNAIQACPEALWGDRSRRPEYWYLVFHTLFFLDYYLSESEEGFTPPAPFTLCELDPAGVMPERVYSQSELRTYLEHGRGKCQATIAALSEARAAAPCGFRRKDITVAELLLYNLRHVQHHAAQLHLILRQTIDSAPPWVGRAKQELSNPL